MRSLLLKRPKSSGYKGRATRICPSSTWPRRVQPPAPSPARLELTLAGRVSEVPCPQLAWFEPDEDIVGG